MRRSFLVRLCSLPLIVLCLFVFVLVGFVCFGGYVFVWVFCLFMRFVFVCLWVLFVRVCVCLWGFVFVGFLFVCKVRVCLCLFVFGSFFFVCVFFCVFVCLFMRVSVCEIYTQILTLNPY